jgi:hypothetical protein
LTNSPENKVRISGGKIVTRYSIDHWEYNNTVLAAADGVRPRDNGVGHHPGMVLQSAPDGTEQCLLFYFTQQGTHTAIQLAELELGADGKAFCNRNKYAPPAR